MHYDTDRFTTLTIRAHRRRQGYVRFGISAHDGEHGLLVRPINNKVDNPRLGVFYDLAMLSRVAARGFLMAVRRSGYNYRHLIIVGYNAQARAWRRGSTDFPS